MSTPREDGQPCFITKALLDVIVHLKNKLELSGDNRGAQYKVNTHSNWNRTIGLRCNFVYIGAVSGYIKDIIDLLARHQTLPLLEYISIARAHETDPTTSRKRSVPWQKTLFITFRPPRYTFEKLLEMLPAAVENYMELDTLVEALQELTDDNV
jgi:hypothetical protein